MMSILLLTAPLFLIVLLGVLVRRANVLDEAGVHVLNRVVYVLALPAIIFTSFAKVDWMSAPLRAALGWNVLFLLGFTALVLLLLALFRIRRDARGAIAACVIVGNTVYLGFPIGTQFLGTEASSLFFAAATPHLVFGIAFAILIIEYYALGEHNPRRFLRDFVRNPLVLALFGGMFFSLLGLGHTFARELLRPAEMIGATASPLALLALGAFVVGKFDRAHLADALLVLLLKLVAFPVVVLVAAMFVGLSPTALSASVIASAMPTAVTVFSVADRYRTGATLVANAVLLSTLLGFFTITGLLLFLR